MSSLIRYYPGDWNLELLLAVTLVVSLASTVAWLISRRLHGKAALRHLILYSALICCLGAPAAAWFCWATDLTLVSIPVFRPEAPAWSPAAESSASPLFMPPPTALTCPPGETGPPMPESRTFTCMPTSAAIKPSANIAVRPPADPSGATLRPSSLQMQCEAQVAVSSAVIPPTEAHPRFRQAIAAAVLLWAAGVLLKVANVLRSCGRVILLRCTSSPLASDHFLTPLGEIAAQLGMRRPPLLRVSDRAVTPMGVGFGPPAVILPLCLVEAIRDEEVRHVLVHEVAHLARGDQRTVLLQALAGALYWPILTVHGLNRELRRAREEICDNAVLAGCSPVNYGKTLLRVAELLVGARPMRASVGMFDGRGKLEKRISGLIDPRRSTATTVGRKPACAAMLLFVCGCAILSATRFAVSAPPSGEPPAQSETAAAPAKKPVQVTKNRDDADDPALAGRFSGRVVDPDGKPLSHARVFVAAANWGQAAPPADAGNLPIRAETDADGRFAFDAPDMTTTAFDGLPTRRPCIVIAACRGYAPDWTQVWGRCLRSCWLMSPTKGTDLRLQLAKDDVPIHGRLLDPGGRPISGVRIDLYSVGIPEGRDLNGFLDRHIKANPLIELDDEYNLLQPDLLPGVTSKTVTDLDGRFTLSGIGRDRLCRLKVTPPDATPDYIEEIMTRVAPDVRVLVGGMTPEQAKKFGLVIHGANFTVTIKPVRIDHGRTVRGIVRDRDTRKPIAGMWVGPVNDQSWVLLTASRAAESDAQGRFTLSGLLAGQAVVVTPPPGVPYQPASVETHGASDLLIECKRGIPFHLKLVDQQRRPVDAAVSYHEIHPNPNWSWPKTLNPDLRAANRGGGNYEGFVLPGPGVVLVSRSDFRPATHVDPKAFFTSGRTNSSAQDQFTPYGNRDKLSVDGGYGLLDQGDYAAIVLVNPAADAAPLELSATVVKDRPRRVFLIDSDGKPVVGAYAMGSAAPWWPLRSGTLPLTGIPSDRATRITFVQRERRLAGALTARANGDARYTVRMQPWATVTGRLLDGNGQPSDAEIQIDDPSATDADPTVGAYANIARLEGGRFRIDELVPGQRYTARLYSREGITFREVGTAFKRLVLRAGEVRNLGDIHIVPTGYAKSVP